MRAAALLVAALLAGAPAAAGEVSFCRVCSGARFVQTKTALLIYCPGAERPWRSLQPRALGSSWFESSLGFAAPKGL